MDAPPVIRCEGVTKGFGGAPVVKDVDFALNAGEVLVLVGPSGSGKTTLLRLVAGFETPDAGSIYLADRPACGNGVWMPPEKRNLGMVFQDYALFPHLKVIQNVSFGLKGWEKNAKAERALSLLQMVQLDQFANRYPYQLSGGEQQRVALARALAPSPLALLLDEPLSNLDPRLRAQLRREVKSILTSRGITALYVTHDHDESLYMGDRVAVINNGNIEQIGTPEEIFHQPANRFVARFLGLADFVAARATDAGLETEMGVIDAALPFSVGTEGELMLRPDDIGLRPSESGRSKIVARVFRGVHNVYIIQLPSGATVHSIQSHATHYPEGMPVDVFLEPHQMLTCFVSNGRSADNREESTFLVPSGNGTNGAA